MYKNTRFEWKIPSWENFKDVKIPKMEYVVGFSNFKIFIYLVKKFITFFN